MNIELSDGVVTLLVRHRVKQGRDREYEAWLRNIIAIARSYPGHLGIDVVRGQRGGLALFTCPVCRSATSRGAGARSAVPASHFDRSCFVFCLWTGRYADAVPPPHL